MRQVPHYLIIGSGRMAKHICYYFDCLGLSYQTWSRKANQLAALPNLLTTATHVLLLITDSVIDQFITENVCLQKSKAILIHFSGSLLSKYAVTAHPLYTFTYELYSPEIYPKIPFIIEENNFGFSTLFPGLNNSHYVIKQEQKAYYHAMCVLANNFTTLLWQKFFAAMQENLKIKKEDLLPYLTQTFENLKNHSDTALTGPISRKDKSTLATNIAALENDEYQTIFKAFVTTHLPESNDD